MDAMVALYESQPFWIWLALGALILAAEAAMGTEWLLWPAVSAAAVAQPFVDGRGRVFVSGSEWPADIDGDAPPVGSSVVVEGFDGPRLKVRT